MDRRPVHLAVMLMALAVAGCQQNERPRPVGVEPDPALPAATTLTLSAEQLMALDWGGRAVGHSRVLNRRRAGAGVEFDIHFPGNSEGVCSMDYTSSGMGGQGTLVGYDVSGYEAFALKFTLLSVNARQDPNVPLEIAVGALIGPAGDGKLYGCEPVALGLSVPQAESVATTPMRTQTIRMIGIHTHIVDPKVWDSNGGIVTLRVEPAPGAQVLPTEVAADGTRSRPGGGRTRPSRSGPGVESPTNPTFGSQHIGAW